MNREDHIKRHKELHGSFDELLADWIGSQPRGLTKPLGNTSIMELVKWSIKQIKDPDELCN